MPLKENENWLMLSVAAQAAHSLSGMPMRGGVSGDVMDADIAALEKLLFLAVRRWAGCIVYMAVAPIGWGYLRTRADAADLLTHGPLARPGGAVIPLKVKPALRIAFSR